MLARVQRVPAMHRLQHVRGITRQIILRACVRLPSKRNKQELRNNETLLTQIRLKLSEYKLLLLQTRSVRLNSHAANPCVSR